jgi:ABC-type Fe3+ transport system permease subunit
VTGLRASTNNKATTVLDVFLEAIGVFGLPMRMRGDRGGENVAVSVYMIMRRGHNRASFMWGSSVLMSFIVGVKDRLIFDKHRSTHNTRIERLWVEVGTQFARAWRAFFIREFLWRL